MEHLVTRDGRLRLWTTLRHVASGEVYTYWTEADKVATWAEGMELASSESEAGRRLVFDLPGDFPLPAGQAVVDFERRDNDTLLTVTQSFVVADGAPEEALETWKRLLERLKGALERSP